MVLLDKILKIRRNLELDGIVSESEANHFPKVFSVSSKKTWEKYSNLKGGFFEPSSNTRGKKRKVIQSRSLDVNELEEIICSVVNKAQPVETLDGTDLIKFVDKLKPHIMEYCYKHFKQYLPHCLDLTIGTIVAMILKNLQICASENFFIVQRYLKDSIEKRYLNLRNRRTMLAKQQKLEAESKVTKNDEATNTDLYQIVLPEDYFIIIDHKYN